MSALAPEQLVVDRFLFTARGWKEGRRDNTFEARTVNFYGNCLEETKAQHIYTGGHWSGGGGPERSESHS